MKIINLNILLLILTSIPNYAKFDWINVYDNGMMALHFKSINCKDKLNCIAIGNESSNPRIFKTVDGGQSWQLVYYDDPRSWTDSIGNFKIYSPAQVAELSYLTNGNIFAVGDSGMIWKSADDGITWDTLKINTKTYPIFIADNYNISMYSNFEGAISGPYELFITNDGWQSFKKVNFSLPDSLRPTFIKDIKYPEKKLLIVLGYNLSMGYYILTSTDSGDSWDTYQPIVPIAVKFHFLDKNNGYAVGGRYKVNTNICKDLIYHTTDGGQSWETQLDTIEHYPDGLSRIYFYDKNYGVAIGNWHKMWRTSNGGKYWYKDSSFNSDITADYFVDIVMLSPNEMIGITDDGEIYKYSEELSIEEDGLNTNANNISISPNPAGEYIEISGIDVNPRFKSWVDGGVGEIRIYNVLGERVKEIPPTPLLQRGIIRVDVSGLAAGVYFVRIGEWMGKFVKW